MTEPNGVTLEELRALLAKATPRPWYVVHGVALCEVALPADHAEQFPDLSAVDFVDVNAPDLEGNAALIVAAVNNLPALLDRLEQAEADRDAAVARAERYREALEKIAAAPSDFHPCSSENAIACAALSDQPGQPT